MAFKPKDKGEHGFAPISLDISRRLIIACRGPEFTRKTSFAFTAPAPIAYFNFEMGHEGVVQLPKFKGKSIKEKRYTIPNGSIIEDADKMKLEAGPIWDDFLASYFWCFSSGKFRTVILDRWDDVYELARLAMLGTTSNDDLYRFQYGKVNTKMKSIIKEPLRHGNVNLLLVQGQREKFDKGGKATGKTTGSGWKDTGHYCQITLDFERGKDKKKSEFAFEVDKCRPNGELEGERFENDMMDFPLLATMAVEGSLEEDWI